MNRPNAKDWSFVAQFLISKCVTITLLSITHGNELTNGMFKSYLEKPHLLIRINYFYKKNHASAQSYLKLLQNTSFIYFCTS